MKKEEREILLKEKLIEMSAFESALYEQGIKYIAGVDEVGRGPLAGPVCAAAVILPEGFDVLGVDDSKKLSEKKRDSLYEEIIAKAYSWGIGLVDNRRIDEINILNATKEAMVLAINSANDKLIKSSNDAIKGQSIQHLLIDAVKLSDVGIPQTSIIKGDAKSISIAAASIVAKVTRDRMMVQFDDIYPGYAFASNKGYGTKAHYEGIEKQGITPIHRRSFLPDKLKK